MRKEMKDMTNNQTRGLEKKNTITEMKTSLAKPNSTIDTKGMTY